MRKFIRTCQECGNEQSAQPPSTDRELSDTYCNAKCRKCKSKSLDYGSWREYDEHGNRVYAED